MLRKVLLSRLLSSFHVVTAVHRSIVCFRCGTGEVMGLRCVSGLPSKSVSDTLADGDAVKHAMLSVVVVG